MPTLMIAASEPAARTVALWLLAGFLGSFLFIRTSARLMRSPKVPWWPGSVTSGDLHIHHLVWGIILLLLCGFLGFATTPRTPWTEILAVLFGVGAGFTLDEFALWLRLEDVYWADQGRASVEAVMIATTFAVFVVVGAVPFPTGSLDAVIPLVVIQLGVIAVLLAKAKYFMALIGLFIWPVAWVGAIRLARPNSRWARRRYAEKPKKLAKCRVRGERWDRRRERFQDLIGGTPTEELAARSYKTADAAAKDTADAAAKDTADTAAKDTADATAKDTAVPAAKDASSGDA
jgi:hypothetical protein